MVYQFYHYIEEILKRFLGQVSKAKLINSLIVLVIAFYGMATSTFKVDEPSMFKLLCIELLSPMQSFITNRHRTLSDFVDDYIAIVNTRKENIKLKSKVKKLENKVWDLMQTQRENERLKKLLDFSKELDLKKVLAQVVGWDSSNHFRALRINKGKIHGILPLSPVITMDGLVGYITRVSYNYSDILTVLDSNNKVDALFDRTRIHGIVEGTSEQKMLMRYINRNQELMISDQIITAGLGNIYPKGIRIGKVTKIENESYGLTQKIEITPAVNFHRLEEVLILVRNDKNSEDKNSEETHNDENYNNENHIKPSLDNLKANEPNTSEVNNKVTTKVTSQELIKPASVKKE